jgi:hypothetical protein
MIHTFKINTEWATLSQFVIDKISSENQSNVCFFQLTDIIYCISTDINIKDLICNEFDCESATLPNKIVVKIGISHISGNKNLLEIL